MIISVYCASQSGSEGSMWVRQKEQIEKGILKKEGEVVDTDVNPEELLI